MQVNNDHVGVHHRRDRKWGKYARLKPLPVEKFIVHGCEQEICMWSFAYKCGTIYQGLLYITSMQIIQYLTGIW